MGQRKARNLTSKKRHSVLRESCWTTARDGLRHRYTYMYSNGKKVYFRSQILERPSIGEYWNIFGVPVLPENVISAIFRTCWCYSEAYNTRTQKWCSIVQYSCTSIWDLKFTFSMHTLGPLKSWISRSSVWFDFVWSRFYQLFGLGIFCRVLYIKKTENLREVLGFLSNR